MSMSIPELERALRALRLSGMIATLQSRAQQVTHQQMNFIEAFSWLVQDELDRRRSRLLERRFALVRREWESQGSVSQCCRGDEGWPLEVGVQKLASNQAVLPWLQDHGSERLSKNRSEETGR